MPEAERRVDHVVLVVLDQPAGLDPCLPAAVGPDRPQTPNTFCTSRRFAELCGPNRCSPPMSMSPIMPRPGTNGGSGWDVFASTFCPTRVRLKPSRAMFNVRSDSTWLKFAGDELIARKEVARELRIIGRQPLVRVVVRVAREQLIAVVQVLVDPAPARSARRASD